MITCEAAYGGIVLPPAPEELLEAILDSRLTMLPELTVTRLLDLPGLANALFAEVAETLRRKQDTISNVGSVRHTERGRRKRQSSHKHQAPAYHPAKEEIRCQSAMQRS